MLYLDTTACVILSKRSASKEARVVLLGIMLRTAEHKHNYLKLH
jgi:hypothetical protein